MITREDKNYLKKYPEELLDNTVLHDDVLLDMFVEIMHIIFKYNGDNRELNRMKAVFDKAIDTENYIRERDY